MSDDDVVVAEIIDEAVRLLGDERWRPVVEAIAAYSLAEDSYEAGVAHHIATGLAHSARLRQEPCKPREHRT